MIELYLLFIHVPNKVRKIAKPRGKSSLRWALAASGAWIGAEFAVALSLVLLLRTTQLYTNWQFDADAILLLIYVAALFFGMKASDKIIDRLESHPVLDQMPSTEE